MDVGIFPFKEHELIFLKEECKYKEVIVLIVFNNCVKS